MLDFLSQINIYNKVLIFIAFIGFVLHLKAYTDWKNQFNWSASVSDVKGFPMVLALGSGLYGTGSLKDDYDFKEIIHLNERFSDIYDENGIRADYGELARNELLEEAPIPKILNLEWYSHREGKYFKGEFSLNRNLNAGNKIKKHFKRGYLDWRGKKRYAFHFMVGIAPKGKVSLWLSTRYNDWTYKIADFEAQKSNSVLVQKEEMVASLEELEDDEKTLLQPMLVSEKEINACIEELSLLSSMHKYKIQAKGTGAKLSSAFTVYGANKEVWPYDSKGNNYKRASFPEKIVFTFLNAGSPDQDASLTIGKTDLLDAINHFDKSDLIDITVYYDKESDEVRLGYYSKNEDKEYFVSDIQAAWE